MVSTLSRQGTAKMYLWKDGSSDGEVRDNAHRQRIANNQILLVSVPGSGKSNFANFWAWSLFKEEYTVVYVTEKEKSSLENAFCAFEVKEPYQKRLLEKQNLEQQIVPIKIYHPFTFNINETQQYPDVFNFFTIPITSLNEDSIAAMIATGAAYDSTAVRLCMNVMGRMQKMHNVWDFLRNAYELMNTEAETFSKNPKDMGLPTPVAGDMRDISKSVSAFSTFWDNWFLQDENCEHNLDFIQLLNDNEHMHFFTAKYIENDRLRYFYYITILNLIDRAIASGKVKRPVVLIIEEIKILLPRKPEISYQKIIAEKLRKMISGLRSQGRGVTTIATTQAYYMTNIDYRSSVDCLILGKLNFEDIKAIMRDYDLNREQATTLTAIHRYEWTRFEHIKFDYCPVFRSLICPFALKEEFYPDFFGMWKKEYPDKMISYKEMYNKLKEKRSLLWEKQLEWLKEQEKNIVVKKEEKEKQKEYKKQLKAEKENIKDDDEDETATIEEKEIIQKVEAVKEPLDKQITVDRVCYEKRLEFPELSWRDLMAKMENYQVGSVITVQKMVFREMFRRGQHELIKKFYTEKFIQQHYRNAYRTIYGKIPTTEPAAEQPGAVDKI